MVNSFLPAFTLDDIAAWADQHAVYCIAENVDVRTQTLGNVRCIARDGLLFNYDSTAPGNTTPDMVTLVSADRRVYRAVGTDTIGNMRIHSVKDARNEDSGISPSTGDAYIVYDSSQSNVFTGGFANRGNQLAVWTGRNWLFVIPFLGKWVYNENTDTDWQFRRSGWVEGVNGRSIADNTVPNTVLNYPMGMSVIEVGRNTPPTRNISNHDAYIVGTNPTGDWALLRDRLVYQLNGEWRPANRLYRGARTFNQDDGALYEWDGTSWQPLPAQALIHAHKSAIGSTVSATTVGTKEGWLIESESYFPALIADGDWVEVQLHTTSNNINAVADNDITSPRAGNGEFAVQSDAGIAPGVGGASLAYYMRFNYRLNLYVGDQTTPYATLTNTPSKGIINTKNKGGGGMFNDATSVYAYDWFRPSKGITGFEAPYFARYNPDLRTHVDFNVVDLEATEQPLTVTLRGNPGDSIKFVLIIDDVEIGNLAEPWTSVNTRLHNEFLEASTDNIGVRPDLTTTARNVNLDISYKYYRNSFEG